MLFVVIVLPLLYAVQLLRTGLRGMGLRADNVAAYTVYVVAVVGSV